MHSPVEPNSVMLAKEKARKNLNKENAAREWIPIILESNKDISLSLDELIYQLCNVVGSIDRSTVLDRLREMNIELRHNLRTT